MPHLFLLTGASGAGKSSILKALLQDTNLSLERFITTTTRNMRPGEVDGKDYWFVSREKFIRERDKGSFFEWAEVYGNFYGSHKQEFTRIHTNGFNKIMTIDVQGAETLKRENPEVITIFIDAPPEEMRERIRERGTSEQDLVSRIEAVNQERAYKDKADYVVSNSHGKLDKAIKETKIIIRSYFV